MSSPTSALDLNLRDLQVKEPFQTPDQFTLTSVAFSKGGTYFAVGDVKGNINVGITKERRWARSHQLQGVINALTWLSYGNTPILVGASEGGWLCAWAHYEDNFRLCIELKFGVPVNAFAFDNHLSRLAVAADTDLLLYQQPFKLNSYTNPIHKWGDKNTGDHTNPDKGRSIYQVPLATNLVFLPNGQLVIGYLAGICVATTSYPFKIKYRKMPDLPSRIGRIAMSPSGGALAITNLASGLEWFSVKEQAFLGTIDYLPSSSSIKAQYANTILDVQFLTERFVVAGHHERCIALIDVTENSVEEPFLIDLGASLDNSGTHRLATTFLNNRPFIMALNGTEIHALELKPSASLNRIFTGLPAPLSHTPETPAHARPRSASTFTLDTPRTPMDNFGRDDNTEHSARKTITAQTLTTPKMKSALKRPIESSHTSGWVPGATRVIIFVGLLAIFISLSDEEREVLAKWLINRANALWTVLSDFLISVSRSLSDVSDPPSTTPPTSEVALMVIRPAV